MMKWIDTHQHFWKYDADTYDWITEEMLAIRRDFLPEDLFSVLQENGVSASIAVQANQTEAETDWLLTLADQYPFIAGVVGWVDLRSDQIKERLEHYSQFPKLKGFRHVLQGEDPAFMLQKDFLNGISYLHQYGFTYDILIFPKHLDASIKLVEQFPDQQFVIDHIAKPDIKHGSISNWKEGIEAISQYQHVCCKLSGMVTEADWANWTPEDMKPYLDVVVNSFGTDRIMFGTDWPVCLVAADYEKWKSVIGEYFSSFPLSEQEKIFSKNAERFYRI